MEKYGTKVHGASDDQVVFDGAVYGQIDYYSSGVDDRITVKFDDGTLIDSYYSEEGIWVIEVRNKGSMIAELVKATDPDSEIYYDILYFKEGPLTAKYKIGKEKWKVVQ